MRKLVWLAAFLIAVLPLPTWACGGGCGGGIIYRNDRIEVEGPNQSWIVLKIVDWSEDKVVVELPADVAEKYWDGMFMELRLTKSASPGWVTITWPKTNKPSFSNHLPVIVDNYPWLHDYAMVNYPTAVGRRNDKGEYKPSPTATPRRK